VATETRLTVDLGERSYPIVIGTGLLESAAEHVLEVVRPTHVAVVAHSTFVLPKPDQTVKDAKIAKCAQTVVNSFREKGLITSLIPVGVGKEAEPTERRKTFEDLQQILDQMLGHGFPRQTCLVALGGGVIGDLAGFAAAIYKRGIAYVQIPTTLLAMVDASVGGKTGINTEHGKNLVGAFWQPRLVLADLTTLETLPQRELAAGMAEVIKHGVIADSDLFEALERDESLGEPSEDLIALSVRRSCEIKASVVAEDERESGKRMILNFGHTIGHALENAIGHYTVPHGEWIAIGMVAEAEIAEALGMVDQGIPRRIADLCRRARLPTRVDEIRGFSDPESPVKPAAWADFLDVLRHDKKVHGDRLRFVLPTRIGEVIIRDDVPLDLVERVFRARGATG
jgi:3-dehydroquinate synthase